MERCSFWTPESCPSVHLVPVVLALCRGYSVSCVVVSTQVWPLCMLSRRAAAAAAAAAIRREQDATSSLWYRLCSTFGVSRLSKRLFSSGSLPPSANESPAHENLDARGGAGWEGSSLVKNNREQNLSNPGSSRPRPASTGDKRRRRKRNSVSSSEGENNPSTTEMAGGGGGGGAAQRLFGRVAAIHWVDGGNGGLAGGSFPTNSCSLARLAALSNLVIRVHGSPYQWGNNCRPFLAFEADAFLDSVESFRQASSLRQGCQEFSSPPSQRAANSAVVAESGSRSSDRECLRDAASRMAHGAGASTEPGSQRGVAVGEREGGRAGTACDVKRMVYFESEQPSLDIHFRVLRELNTE